MSDYGYKVLTHDLRPPIRGGNPLWREGEVLPLTLPAVALDRSEQVCAAGWHFCRTGAEALQSAGFWPNGRPARLFAVRAEGTVVRRGDKYRTDRLTILREVSVLKSIRALSRRWFSDLAEEMYQEQAAWYRALGRPRYDRERVVAGLQAALAARGLEWTLQEYPSTWDAEDARYAWDAWDTRAARAARAAWAARAAGAARAAWAARAAGVAWDARDARAAWYAWDAGDALLVYYVRSRGWTTGDPAVLTTGLREAYAHGLAIALPTAPQTLGWAMVPMPSPENEELRRRVKELEEGAGQ